MYFRLDNLDRKSAEAFAAIPDDVTSLDLSWNNLDRKSGAELAQTLGAIPDRVASLNLNWNYLGYKSGTELAEAFATIPVSVTSLNLSENDLDQKSGAELAQALAAIPVGVTSLNLSWNNLGNKSGAELAQAFAEIPVGVTSLNLSENGLDQKSGAELAQAFAAIPVGVTSLNLSENDLDQKSDAELAEAFAAVPVGVTINYGNDKLQNHIHYLLDSYLKERAAVTDSSRRTKEYFYGSFFSIFQKSFTQKRNAVIALKSALSGNDVNLSEHLSTLRNGNLGKELRTFIKLGMGNTLVEKEVTTVSEFVQALQEKNTTQMQPS